MNTKDLSTKMELQVYDQSGRLLEKKSNITAGSVIRVGEKFKAGVYHARMIQGEQHSEIELVKL